MKQVAFCQQIKEPQAYAFRRETSIVQHLLSLFSFILFFYIQEKWVIWWICLSEKLVMLMVGMLL